MTAGVTPDPAVTRMVEAVRRLDLAEVRRSVDWPVSGVAALVCGLWANDGPVGLVTGPRIAGVAVVRHLDRA